MSIKLSIFFAVFLAISTVVAQEQPDQARLKEPVSRLWLNSYGKFRLSDKFFWIAQLHYRRVGTEETPMVGRMGQIYNRHAINYQFSKRFNVSLGGVLRIDYSPESGPDLDKTVLEPRIWHQYLFVMPFPRVMVYHRFRIEHRWSRNFEKGSEYYFRNRWRYMFNVSIPLNKPTLKPGAFYFKPEVELIMQSGDPIVESPLEDLRIHPGIGYILNPRVTFATGLMYSMGQELSDGAYYKQKLTLRLHIYVSLDFRDVEEKLPSVHFGD